MKIHLLEAFGIDPEIIRIWRKKYGNELLPIQEEAVKKHNIFADKNLIVFAPTSSGKTFIGEMLAVIQARRKKRVFYLVPMKSLAEEKFNQVRTDYFRIGIRTVISTHDRHEFDEDIVKGNYDIAVIVYEKLLALLVKKPSLLAEIGLVVIDELQMIGDEDRGSALEILLTRILLSQPRPQLLGLSAVLGKCEELAKWLGADLLVDDKRPVELRKGVYCNGVFQYQEHNSQKEGKENWGKTDSKRLADIILYIAQHLSKKKEQTILFLRDKSLVEYFASKLTEMVNLSPAKSAIKELSTYEESVAQETLIKFLKKGICIHHADLTYDQRELIEQYYRKGEIKLLCSTTTLAMGLNLPAKNAIIDSQKWHYFKDLDDLRTVDITKAEYENMGGRVGRYGFVKDFGRAILVTQSPYQAKTWSDYYVRGGFDILKPSLDKGKIDKYILNLIACNVCKNVEEIKKFLQSTFTGATKWNKEITDESYAQAISKTTDKCLEFGLIEKIDNNFVATRLGKITAEKGISIMTCVWFLDWIRKTEPGQISILEILVLVGLSKDADQIYIPLRTPEIKSKRYQHLLNRLISEQQEESKPLFQSLFKRVSVWTSRAIRGIKKALFLYYWIGPEPTVEIEKNFETLSGAIRRCGEEYSWLTETLSALAKSEGWNENAVNKIENLSQCLTSGVIKEAIEFVKLKVRGLGRAHIKRLVGKGYTKPDYLNELSMAKLKKLLPQKIARKLYNNLHPEKMRVSAGAKNSPKKKKLAKKLDKGKMI